MEENENLEELVNPENGETEIEQEDAETSSPGEEAPASSEENEESEDKEELKEQIIDAIKEMIEENESDIEGADLLDHENIEETTLEDPAPVDYTELLTEIQEQLQLQHETLLEIQEQDSRTIFDKPLNEYNVTETVLVFGVLVAILATACSLIKHFTPRIWH